MGYSRFDLPISQGAFGIDTAPTKVAKEFNEARHRGGPVDLPALRKELIQTAAMAVAWADAIGVLA